MARTSVIELLRERSVWIARVATLWVISIQQLFDGLPPYQSQRVANGPVLIGLEVVVQLPLRGGTEVSEEAWAGWPEMAETAVSPIVLSGG